MYHVSDLKKFIRCPRLFYQSREESFTYIPFMRNDETLTVLFAQKLNINEYFLGERNDSASRVKEAFEDYSWFLKARFEADGLRIKIPILHKTDQGIDVYFTHYGLYPKESDLDYYRLHLYVLKRNGFNINEIYIIHLNANYVLKGELNPDELFVVSDSFYNDKNNPTRKIKDSLSKCDDLDVEAIIFEMNKNDLNDYAPIKKRVCHGRSECAYYQNCFPHEIEYEDDSILTLVSSRYKNKMYEEGIRSLKDANLELIEGSRLQYAQIMASRNGGLYYDIHPLKEWMKRFDQKPICFLDFEWDRYLIPPFEGLHPCDVVCFEFALYILDEQGELHHKTYIGTKDCRKEFIEELLNAVPKSGPIVAYNAMGAECIRLKELALQFPEYADDLLALNERFVDMAYPFVTGYIYDTRMRGNFTLKQLVSVVSDYSYRDMDIHDGMDAVFKWRYLDNDDSSKDLNEVKEHLKEYCSLDAYGLYLVYNWLNEIVYKPIQEK